MSACLRSSRREEASIIADCGSRIADCRGLARCGTLALWLGLMTGFGAPGAQPVPMTALTFSPDGARVVAAAHRSVAVRAAKDGKLLRSIACEFPKIASLMFNLDGSLLAVAGGTPGERGAMVLLDWKSSTVVARLDGFDDVVTSVALSPDNSHVAVASADHSAKVLRVEGRSLTPAFPLVGHSGPVLGVAFSPDGKLIVTASADRTVRVWDAKEGRLLRTFSHHTATVHAVAFRPAPTGASTTAPSTCVTASDDKTVRVWQPEIGRMVRIIRGHDGPAHTLVWSRDGARLFSGGSDGVVRVIEGESDQILHHWRASEDWLYAMAVSPKDDALATGDWRGEVKLWSVAGATATRVW